MKDVILNDCLLWMRRLASATCFMVLNRIQVVPI